MSVWTQAVTLAGVTPDDEPLDWTPREQPLGPPPAPVSPAWQPPTQYPPYQQPVSGPILPPPQNVTYVQPVARKGLTGPHAAVWITVIVLGVLIVLPTLCCLGLMVIGAANQTSSQ